MIAGASFLVKKNRERFVRVDGGSKNKMLTILFYRSRMKIRYSIAIERYKESSKW